MNKYNCANVQCPHRKCFMSMYAAVLRFLLLCVKLANYKQKGRNAQLQWYNCIILLIMACTVNSHFMAHDAHQYFICTITEVPIITWHRCLATECCKPVCNLKR